MDLPDSSEMEFNMSFDTNTRINVTLWQIKFSRKNNNAVDNYMFCNDLFLECIVDMKEPEEKQHRDMKKKIEAAIDNYNRYIGHYNSNNMGKRMPFNPPRESFDLLFEWEIMLRRKLDKMKLLFKRSDDVYSAMV